jgi:branched-chain amino acid transport system permease protein
VAIAAAAPTAGVHDFRPTRSGLVARILAATAILAGVLILPALFGDVQDHRIAKAAIYAIIGLSVNVITGHAGQISLGHQAFVGIGAFMSAFVISKMGGFFPGAENLVLPPTVISTSDFLFGVAAAGLIGAGMALGLGLAALRIRGLYLALITLAFGLTAENSIFNWRSFTGGGAGLPAPRPIVFASDHRYAYLCLAFVGLFLLIDWRLVKTRAGRAIVALRNDEVVASTLGVNVTRYKLLAFATGGLMAGVAGALFAHWNGAVQALDFVLQTALVWILMAVVGGLGSRAGVVIGSAFFALFDLVLGDLVGEFTLTIPLLGEVLVETVSPFLGALLLILTITLYPGGIGQQILPLRRWLAGGLLVEDKHDLRLAGLPLLVTFLALLIAGVTWYLALAYGLGAGVITAVLLVLYLRRTHRTLAAHRRRAEAKAAGAETLPVPEGVAGGGRIPSPASTAEARPDAEPEPAVPGAGPGAGPEAAGSGDATRGDGRAPDEESLPEAGAPAAGTSGRASRFSGLRRRKGD